MSRMNSRAVTCAPRAGFCGASLSDRYLNAAGSAHGFLLSHSVGHKPKGSQVDVPIIYADYYFLEALLRYRQLD
ncbi:MAG: hypothetical protein V8Q54_10970 [Alistipes senegalensis]